nr:putative ribonuclease h protein [Quercus suber]
MDEVYLVKAGYRLLVEEELSSSVSPLPTPHPRSPWKSLWKLRIQSRTKTLMWRAISEALPTHVNLVKRKVLNDATCQLCGLKVESTLHALWSCPNLNVESGKAGLGTIICNNHGLVMAALTQIIPLPILVEMVEVLAARRALCFAWVGFDHIILEVDIETAIRAMNLGSYSTACFGHILSNIKALSTHFRELVFRHTCRQGNKVAYSLAWAARNFPPLCTWMEEVPESSVDVYLVETINIL